MTLIFASVLLLAAIISGVSAADGAATGNDITKGTEQHA